MEFTFEGFESSDFETELEDVEVKRIKKFERIWRWGFGGSVAYHVLDDGIAYFAAMDAFVYAVDSVTGKLLWKFKTGASNFGSVSNVYKGFICVPSYDHNVYCLNANSGKEMWRFNTGDKAFGAPVIDDDVAFFSSRNGFFFAANLNDGSILWRFKTGGEIGSAPVVYGKNVMIGSFDGYWYCLDRKTGKEEWRFKTGGEIIIDLPAKIHDGILYITSHDSYLYAINAETGKEIWRTKTGKYGNNTSVNLVGDKLISGSRDGYVFAFTKDGKEKWRFRTGGIVIGTSVHKNRIYFGSEDGNFHCIDADGKEIWRFRFGEGGSYDYPSFFNGMVIVGSMDCHVYALNEDTGEEVWRFETSSKQHAIGPPPHEQFEHVIKKETHIEDAISDEKYKSREVRTVSLSDYHFRNDYATTSEYKQKSDYDAQLVNFDEVLESLPNGTIDGLHFPITKA
jgi:outer membrane protein assembly factor BamB